MTPPADRAPGLISVLCPTRLREYNVGRLLDSIAETARQPVEVVFYTDDDAPLTAEAAGRPGVVEVTGPRITLSQMWNECYKESRGEIVMQCGDDIVFRTPDWDERVREVFAACPDKILLVYGDDLYQGQNLATHGFVHHSWVDTVGHFTPPYFSCDYGDRWLHDVAVTLGRLCYLPNVITEHLHPVAGKAAWDVVHEERTARGERDRVGDLYEAKLPERQRDAATLRDLIGSADGRA